MTWPEPPDWLELTVQPRRLTRGGTVDVTLEARPHELFSHSRELGLGCLAHRAGTFKTGEIGDAGGRFRMDRQDLVHADWRQLTRDNFAEPFEFAVPANAPYSYEGDVVSFYWAVWLRREARAARPPSCGSSSARRRSSTPPARPSRSRSPTASCASATCCRSR